MARRRKGLHYKVLRGVGFGGVAQDGFKIGGGFLAGFSSAASAYHGYKRNYGSIGWGLFWGTAGAVFPIITPLVALYQGYAAPAEPYSIIPDQAQPQILHGPLGQYYIAPRPDPMTVLPPQDLMFRYMGPR